MAYTHEVVHKGFYRRVAGQLVALPVGMKLELTKEQGERMTKNGLVKPIDQPNGKQTINPVAKPEPEPVIDDKAEEKPKPKQQRTTKGRKSKK